MNFLHALNADSPGERESLIKAEIEGESPLYWREQILRVSHHAENPDEAEVVTVEVNGRTATVHVTFNEVEFRGCSDADGRFPGKAICRIEILDDGEFELDMSDADVTVEFGFERDDRDKEEFAQDFREFRNEDRDF